jgi:hypothetical protein
MTRIVRTAYRYKRPPRRKQPVALEVPAVVKAADPAKARKRAKSAESEDWCRGCSARQRAVIAHSGLSGAGILAGRAFSARRQSGRRPPRPPS